MICGSGISAHMNSTEENSTEKRREKKLAKWEKEKPGKCNVSKDRLEEVSTLGISKEEENATENGKDEN